MCRYCAQASSTTSHCSVCDTSQVQHSIRTVCCQASSHVRPSIMAISLSPCGCKCLFRLTFVCYHAHVMPACCKASWALLSKDCCMVSSANAVDFAMCWHDSSLPLQDLWICLICGHVGCGRGTAKHAVDHWKESGHCYSLELESQRVCLHPSPTLSYPYLKHCFRS